jgi:hypothetical protein
VAAVTEMQKIRENCLKLSSEYLFRNGKTEKDNKNNGSLMLKQENHSFTELTLNPSNKHNKTIPDIQINEFANVIFGLFINTSANAAIKSNPVAILVNALDQGIETTSTINEILKR